MSTAAQPPAPAVYYGTHPDQVANLHLPARSGGPWPVAVLIHGGFWRHGWDRTLMTPLAHDLAKRGVAAWNIEYRRVGQSGGGWPGTFEDVAAAIDYIPTIPELDPGRVAVIGHSAGGHLALWTAARRRLPPDAPGSNPTVTPKVAVSQAGVVDLPGTYAADLGDGAARDLMGGGPADFPERYAAASPTLLLPLGTRQLLVHGDRDDAAPIAQSRLYLTAARAAGDDVDLVEVEHADHFDVIDVHHEAWAAVVTFVKGLL